MKKITLLLLTILFSYQAQSQISITDGTGEEIVDGYEYTYNVLGEIQAQVEIHITNNGASTAYILGEVVSMENASGENLQFCLGDTCYATITEGSSYPISSPVTLDAGESNGNFDHFFNAYEGTNTNEPVKYSFRFYEVDADGNELGDIVSFSYTYDASLSTANYNLNNLGVNLNSSLVTNTLSFNTKENITLSLYDLNGRSISTNNYTQGEQQLNVSQLNAGVYIVKFNTNSGKQASTKIIKK